MRLEPLKQSIPFSEPLNSGRKPVRDCLAVSVLGVKIMTCNHCQKETEGDKRYCSLECMRRHKSPEKYKNCAWCGKEFYQKSKGAVYCTASCAHKHRGQKLIDSHKPKILEMVSMGARRKDIERDLGIAWSTIQKVFDQEGLPYVKDEDVAKRKKSDLIEKTKNERILVAKVLLLTRKGVTLEDAFESLETDYKRRSIHGMIDKHCIYYKKLSKKRKANSEWRKRERKVGSSSKIFKKESDFRDYISEMLKGEVEVSLNGVSGRRCDVVASLGGELFAIECKTSTRTKDVDTAIGQAILSAFMLGMKPAIAFPSDCHLDNDANECCKKFDIKVIRDIESLPLVGSYRNEKFYKDDGAWWGGLKSTWKKIKGTKDATPEKMKELGFNKQQISSCLGVPICQL